MRAAEKPSPNSIPRTPGMENTAWERRASTESKKGLPRPAGTLSILHSTIPPSESPSRDVSSRRASHFDGSVSPPISFRPAWNEMSFLPTCSERLALHCFLAITPAATRGRVSLPEKCPPPRGSLNPFHLTEAVKSAWPGLGTSRRAS